MAQEHINTGSSANDGTGSPLRNAFTASENNFTELYDNINTDNLFSYTGGAQITGSLRITGSLFTNGDIQASSFRADKFAASGSNATFISMSHEDMWVIVNNTVATQYNFDDSANSGFIKINPGATNFFFQIAGDTITSLFYVDPTNDRVGINTNSPSALLDVNGGFRTNTMTIANLQDGDNGLSTGDLFFTSSEYFGASTPYQNIVCVK